MEPNKQVVGILDGGSVHHRITVSIDEDVFTVERAVEISLPLCV
jgi:hypothetical protein